MPGPDFPIESYDYDRSPRRSLVAIVLLVVLATVGIVLLIRACGSRGGEKSGEQPQDAATSESTPGKAEAAPAEAKPEKSSKKVDAPAAPTPALKSPAASTAPASKEALEIVSAGEAAEQRDDFYAARTNYLAALSRDDLGAARAHVESRLGVVDIQLVFTPREMPGKVDHAIQKGESLKIIAARFNTPVDLIIKANGVPNPNRIQVGDRLRLLDNVKFAIEVSKSENWLLVTLNGEFFKRYVVGTGKFNRTPVGTFRVYDKIAEPPWWRPDGSVVPYGDKENILGTRWMAIEATGDTPPARGYGIHGTWDDSSLGQQSSAGCVRMKNEDVEELFTFIPRGTPVTIHE